MPLVKMKLFSGNSVEITKIFLFGVWIDFQLQLRRGRIPNGFA